MKKSIIKNSVNVGSNGIFLYLQENRDSIIFPYCYFGLKFKGSNWEIQRISYTLEGTVMVNANNPYDIHSLGYLK